ncbi:hypothetical protein Q8F55_007864 [Vanrija albida]|uniref:Uncharacterized protein n=1 Tax=Vanrija albida TaxID=181172 RepID=A0ABR3PVL8_9TREE
MTASAWGHHPSPAPPHVPPNPSHPTAPLGPFNFTYAPSAGADPVTLRGVITPLSAPLPAYLAQNEHAGQPLRTFIYADFVQRQADPVPLPVCTCVHFPSGGQQAAVHSVPVFRVDVPQAAPAGPASTPGGVLSDLPQPAAPTTPADPPPSVPSHPDPPGRASTGIQTDPAGPARPKASILQPPERPPRRRVVSKNASANPATPAREANPKPAADTSEPTHDYDRRLEDVGSTPHHTPKARRSRPLPAPPVPPLPPLNPPKSLHLGSTAASSLSGSPLVSPPLKDSLVKDKGKAKVVEPILISQDRTWPRARFGPRPPVPATPFPLTLDTGGIQSNTARPSSSQRSSLPEAWTNGSERPSVESKSRDVSDWRLAMG